MNDRVLARFADRLAPDARQPDTAEEREENLSAFSILRGVRAALMLELRLKNGNIVAFSYAMLDRASFDPSDGIRLRFAGQEVHLSGRQLNEPGQHGVRLFDAILRHRVIWIQEASRAELLQASPGEPIVESIAIES